MGDLNVLRSTDGNSYDPELRGAVAQAIKRYPNTDAEWWIGPEAALHAVEEFLFAHGIGEPDEEQPA